MLETVYQHAIARPTRRKPRLGFAEVGWVGRNRLEAIAASGVAEIAAIADTTPTALIAAAAHAPDAASVGSFEELLELDLDGVVIATPNALHASQAMAALRAGKAVFCQKPLARTGPETRQVLAAAADANRLLGVDLSYRHAEAVRQVKKLIDAGELGDVYAAELVFHHASGPDKPWFYDPELAGGGCLLDVGLHLVDLALWCLDFPTIAATNAHFLTKGRARRENREVEDYAAALITTTAGTAIQLACAWHAPVSGDAHIEARFFGTRGGATFRNVNGSLEEFMAERSAPDRSPVPLAHPPDAWRGRAVVAWAEQLARRRTFDPKARHLQQLADTLDRLYQRER